jgi:hypothetical protein
MTPTESDRLRAAEDAVIQLREALRLALDALKPGASLLQRANAMKHIETVLVKSHDHRCTPQPTGGREMASKNGLPKARTWSGDAFHSNKTEFEERLRAILNGMSMEQHSNTPDFILARYLLRCLEAFDCAVESREEWYGRDKEAATTVVSA